MAETFTLRNDATGEVIMTGSLAACTEPILDSTSRRACENLVRDAFVAVGRIDSINLRAEQVIERKRQVEERERADAVRRFCDDVLKLNHRVDVWEAAQRAKVVDALLRRLPDPEDHLGRSVAQQEADAADNLLAPSPMPPPHGDRQELDVALAAERERDDQGDLPEELAVNAPPPSGNFTMLHPIDDPRDGGKSVPQPVNVSLNSNRADNSKPSRIRKRWEKRRMRMNHGNAN
jgi:hypothetical protein